MSATLLPNAEQQFVDANGKPLAGGSVYFYIPNTSTPKSTWQDSAQTVLNANPVILDGAGRAVIWGSGTYRQVLYDQFNNLIWDKITEDANSGLVGTISDQTYVAGTDFTPGTTTQLTLPATPGASTNLWVFFNGTFQGDDQYSVSGMTLTFNSAIPVGVTNVYVKVGTTVAVSTPSAGSVTDASVASNANINSSKLAFNLGAPGSVLRTLYSRLKEIVSLRDFNAKGDGVTDDTAAVQAALNYMVTVGGELYVPPGNYLLTGSGVTLDLSSIADNQELHVSIIGSNSGASQFYYTGTGAAFTCKGSSPSSINTYLTMQDVRFLGNSQTSGSIGIQLTVCSGIVFRNVMARVFTLGMNCTDVLQSAFYDCNFSVNGGGLSMNYATFSQPNAVLFSNCEFIDNLNYAALLGNPTTVNFVGGAVQGNGQTGAATFRYGIAVITNNSAVGLAGALACTFVGVYFENNAYKADIWFQCGNGTDGPTALTVVGCTFNRLTSAVNQFVNYNVLVDVNLPNPGKITLIGNGFNGFSPYVPSSSTPYVFINDGSNAPFDVVDYGNLYVANIEKPVYLGPVKADTFTVSAAVTFDGTAGSPTPSYKYNAPSITKLGTGVYKINFQKAGTLGVYPVDVIVGSGNGYGSVQALTTNSVTVNTFNASGVSTDFAYVSVKVFGNGDVA